MKTRLAAILLLLAFGVSCGNEDTEEPAQWLLYLTFMNSEGHDFFDSVGDQYSSDSVFVLENGNPVSFDDVQSFDGRYAFGWAAWGASTSSQQAIFHISFGNGDVDTLSYDWEPSSVQSVSSDSFSKLKKLRFYYNGFLVEEWDMKDDPGLEQELVNRNTPWSTVSNGGNPIVVALPKTPDPNEFN